MVDSMVEISDDLPKRRTPICQRSHLVVNGRRAVDGHLSRYDLAVPQLSAGNFIKQKGIRNDVGRVADPAPLTTPNQLIRKSQKRTFADQRLASKPANIQELNR
jgi:hypothetical protein